jgi:hypothetical protein
MSVPITGYPDHPPPGLNEAVEEAGVLLVNVAGVWTAANEEQADLALRIAASYDPVPYVKAAKAAELAEKRWEYETGGFMFQPSGADRPYRFVSTREAMGPVIAAVLAVQNGIFPDPTLWKTAEGVFVPIRGADVIPLFKAFAAHVAGAFAEEAMKRDAADKAASVDDIVQIAIDGGGGGRE